MKVLITGASSGIGKDLAREFAKLKYDVVLVSRTEDKLINLKEELTNKYHINADYYIADLSNENECRNLYEKYKDIDILVNNAGFGDLGLFSETSLEKELQMIKTNIIGLHILTKLYLIKMKEKNSGKILNVASIAGFMPGPLMATYYASKNYVVRLSEAIREELRSEKSNVTISILCPGPVKTNFNNVANVKFNIKGLTSEYVAKYTVKKLLKNKFYIVPGFGVKFAKISSKIVPTSIMAKCAYFMQKKKEGKQ